MNLHLAKSLSELHKIIFQIRMRMRSQLQMRAVSIKILVNVLTFSKLTNEHVHMMYGGVKLNA